MPKIRLSKKNISFVLGIIVLCFTLFKQSKLYPAQPMKNSGGTAIVPIASTSSELIKVTRVVDGDTIELENKKKVRYIGINTPELHDPRRPVQCFGKEAMEANKKLVEGKQVRLEKDVSETDKYKRLLRYVYLPTESSPSGIFVNDYLVKEGYAVADTYPPDVKYANHFLELQNEARQNKKGLWSKCR